jgi:dUTP pyrophosphatase
MTENHNALSGNDNASDNNSSSQNFERRDGFRSGGGFGRGDRGDRGNRGFGRRSDRGDRGERRSDLAGARDVTHEFQRNDRSRRETRVDIIHVYAKFQDVKMPSKATEGSAGYDVHAFIQKEMILEPGRVYMVPTGLNMQMPENYECQIRSRSGLAVKHGIIAVLGTIDSDYRDEVQVILHNTSSEQFVIEPNMRIAQFVFNRLPNCKIEKAEFPLSETSRTGGFGSTGLE